MHGICARKQDIMNENIVIVLFAGINELESSFVLFYLTVLVYFFTLLNFFQLFTSVSVVSAHGVNLQHCVAAREISITSHLGFGN